MRYLGIDYGTKKVGLALSDEEGNMAFPHSVVPNDAVFLDTIEQLVASEQIGEIVVGQSLNLDGTPNTVQTDIDEFIADMTLRTPVPIHLEPEQLTTQQAAAIQGKDANTDAAAAALILDSFLTKLKNKSAQTQVSTEEKVVDTEESETVPFEQFAALDIRIGTIVSVDVVLEADKLLQLTVDVGEETPRTIVSGIRKYFTDPQELEGKQCPFVLNLPPRKIRGVQSQGMILACGDDSFSLLSPAETQTSGTPIR